MADVMWVKVVERSAQTRRKALIQRERKDKTRKNVDVLNFQEITGSVSVSLTRKTSALMAA